MTIDLPLPDSRTAVIWAELLTAILNIEYPYSPTLNAARSTQIINELLTNLGAYYAKTTTR